MSRFSKNTAYMVLAGLMFIAFACVWTMSPLWTRSSEGTVIISGNTPAALRDAHLVGHAKPERQIDVVVGLKFRNEKDLDDLIARQSDPTSPDFRKYLAPDEFVRKFAPSQTDVNKVVAHLKKSGLTVIEIAPNHMLVHVRGSVSQVEKAFDVHINVYTRNAEEHFSNDRDPSVPAELKDIVESVIGLNTFAEYHSRLERSNKASTSLPTGYGPKDIATAYDYPNANNKAGGPVYTGKGVTIAIATAYTYDLADVQAYWSYYGIHRTGTVTNVQIGGKTKQLDGETTLDLQQAGGQAPGADIIMYEGKTPSFANFAMVFNRIVMDNKASVVTVSWGLCEDNTGKAEMATEHAIFKAGTAQGISFFAAAGDDGAYDCPNAGATYSVDYPSSDPYVTAVGGTALQLNGNGSRKAESAWTGAGGGESSQYDEPAWQSGNGVPANQKRNTSDVSLNADPRTGYSIYFEGSWDSAGGTSFASPAWAGLWGLAVEANGGRLGYVSPLVYRIGRSADYGKVFYDVTTGNNGNHVGPGYDAGPAWDHPTGWGVPNGHALINWILNDKAAPAAGGDSTKAHGR